MFYYLSLFFILYLPFQVALNPFEGIDLASARILAIVIFLIWMASGLKNKKINLPSNLKTLLIISFLFLALFSIFFVENPSWAWKKMLFLLSFFPLYFVFSDLARRPQMSPKIVRFLVYSGALASLVALFQFGLQFVIGLDKALDFWRKIMPPFLGSTFSQAVFGYSSWLVSIGGENYFRAIAFFPDPHMLSLFLGLIFPWSISMALQKTFSQTKGRLLFWAMALLILLADFFTFSRGGYLGLAGGMFFLFYWLIKKYRQKFAPYFLILIILFSAGIIIPNPLSQRMFSSLNPNEGSNRERLKNWSEALEIIRIRPLTGTGLGNYSLAVKPTAQYREPIYAHNLYLDMAAETGIINGLILIAILGTSIFTFIKKARYAIFYLGGATGLIIFSVHSFFETGFFSVQVLPVLIIILALTNAPEAEKKD